MFVPVGQGVRQTPSRHTLPPPQSASDVQNGRGSQLGRQNASTPHASPALLHVALRQSARQRPPTQYSPPLHCADAVHSLVSASQKPPRHAWPDAHCAALVQRFTQALSTHARPAPHS
jgi:hypothetical protein